jgi:hypothetical protein
VGFTCSVCGRYHDERMLDIRADLPDAIFRVADRGRAWIADDFAVLDDEHFYVRGLLEVPIPELDDRFAYGAWLEVVRADFTELMGRWRDESQFDPVHGYLANELEPYRATLGLGATLRPTTPDKLPLIELDEGQHELVREQRTGITVGRSDELAAVVLHAA